MIFVLMILLTFFASLIGVTVGFGLSTIMIPVLVIFYPFTQVLLLVGVIHWFSNIWKITFFKHGIDWSLILSFGIPGVIAAIIGARLAFLESQAILSRTLGTFLIIYVIFLLLNPTFQIKKQYGVAIIGGGISGFLAGIFGFRGAIRSSFLSTFNLPKAVFIATGAVIAISIDTARLITYWIEGHQLEIVPLWALGILIGVSWTGSFAARYIVKYIPQEKFRFVVVLFLLIMSVKLIVFPSV